MAKSALVQMVMLPGSAGRIASIAGAQTEDRQNWSSDHDPSWLKDIAPHSAEACDTALRWLLLAFELLAITAAFALAFPPTSGVDAQRLVAVAAATAGIWILARQTADFNSASLLRFNGRRMVGLGALWLLVFIASWGGATLSSVMLPAAGWQMVFLVGFLGLFLVRLSIWVLAGRLMIRGDACRQIALVGRKANIEGAVIVTQTERPGSHICSIIDTDWSGDRPVSAGGPLRVDEIVLALGPKDPMFEVILARLRTLPISISLLSGENGTTRLLRVQGRPLSGGAQIAKRGFDIAASILLLLIFSPLMLLLAVLIKATAPKDPVFYLQRRHGFNQRTFFAYKFRTMHAPSDQEEAQAVRGDRRVTRIGRFLRASSIDELPQLVNVIAGDMSLVGPRPHPVWLNQKFSDVINGYMARHRVRPGITGLAQVNGLRGETETVDKMRRRVELDLLYIEKWSIWLDLAILVRTAFALVKAENAY